MNNMPYPFMPDINMINPAFPYPPNSNNKVMELEEQVNRLNREVKRLEHRVNKLEKKHQLYVSKEEDADDTGIYMM